MTAPGDLLSDLEARGLIHDSTDRAALAAALRGGPITLYCGFDPTADSLHVGSLLGLLVLRRFQEAGHRTLALAGGATGMIGDPSGRSDERNLLGTEELAHNLQALSDQITRILGDNKTWDLVNNADWTRDVTLLDFLRDVGKHVTVNQMVAKESVRSRMEGDSGISFTEFSYMLLQAHDYWWLAANEGCSLQIGGSDQWGNITAGIELVRRRGGGAVHGLTWPLLLRSDGTKFGKSASGESVWLDPARTSPYRFFQFWMHAEDADVERLLLQLTFVPVEEIAALMADQVAAPARRLAQARLAAEVTAIVHGSIAAASAAEASAILFSPEVGSATAEALEMLAAEIPTVPLSLAEAEEGVEFVDLLVRTGLCASKAEARRTLDQGGGYLNGSRAASDAHLSEDDLLHGRFALLRRGRKACALVVLEA